MNSLAAPPKLKKALKARQFFTLGFGTIVGVGWVVALGEWLNQAGPLGAILAFLAGGVVVMLVGLCYAEMATMLPVSGGEVAYTYEAFGIKACFATGWFLTLAYVATTVFEALSLGWIAKVLLPGIQGPTLYVSRGEPVHLGTLLLGLGGMALITYLNYRGTNFAAGFQDTLTYTKIGLAAIFISAGLLWGKTANLMPPFQASSSAPLWEGVLAVFLTAPFWCAGFNVIPQVMEEKAPGTSLNVAGRMLLASIGMSVLFYCLVILSCSMSAPWKSLVALDLPAAGAFDSAFRSPLLAKMILWAALLGNMTAWNGALICASRVLFALGRAQIIHPFLGRVHPVQGSPAPAVVFAGVLGGCCVFLGRRAIIPIVNVAATCFALAFFLICLCVIKMRRTRPHQQRPYRLPGGTATAGLATLASLFMVFVSLYEPYVAAKEVFPLEWTLLLAWAALGSTFWVVAERRRSRMTDRERRDLILGVDPAVENPV